MIKWVECAAESVVCLAGPELYRDFIDSQNGVWVNSIAEMIPAAEALLHNPERRLALAHNAHHQVRQRWALRQLLPQRLWLYEQLWQKREAIDRALLQRWPQAARVSSLERRRAATNRERPCGRHRLEEARSLSAVAQPPKRP